MKYKHNNRMIKPDLISEFEYEGKVIVEWFDVFDKDQIPDYKWQHVYMIGNINGKVPIVMYNEKRDNLPGGRLEPGESLDETLKREAVEELNMEVLSWQPLGYQRLTRPLDDTPTFQFRAYAQLRKIGEFESDPGGGVIGHKVVDLNEVNDHIKYGVVGNRLINNCKKYF